MLLTKKKIIIIITLKWSILQKEKNYFKILILILKKSDPQVGIQTVRDGNLSPICTDLGRIQMQPFLTLRRPNRKPTSNAVLLYWQDVLGVGAGDGGQAECVCLQVFTRGWRPR